MEIKQEPRDVSLLEIVNINKEQEHIITQTTIKVEPTEVTNQHCTEMKLENENILDLNPTETDNINEVRAQDFFVNVSDLNEIKHEVDVQPKYELLNEECDIPSIKTENDPLGFCNQPCSSKQSQDKLHLAKKLTAKKQIKKKKTYRCPVCIKDFPSSCQRKFHLDGHFKKYVVMCLFCGEMLTDITLYKNHSMKYLVKISKKLCKTKYGITDRKKRRHDEKTSICAICSKEFKFKYQLMKHMSFHQSTKCEICGKAYSQKSYLKTHINIHTGSNLFKCHICYKTFTRTFVLQEHLRYHVKSDNTGVLREVFSCSICLKKFKLKEYLLTHIKQLHTQEKKFKCNVCFQDFTRKQSLKNHLKIHSENLNAKFVEKNLTEKIR